MGLGDFILEEWAYQEFILSYRAGLRNAGFQLLFSVKHAMCYRWTFIFSVEKYILYINFHFIIWISSDRASLNNSLKSLIMVTRVREIFSMYGSRAGLMPIGSIAPNWVSFLNHVED
jgi:hypothetical protein